jgi:hypothetical protein
MDVAIIKYAIRAGESRAGITDHKAEAPGLSFQKRFNQILKPVVFRLGDLPHDGSP